MKSALCLLVVVTSSTAQFISVSPVSLTSSLEGQIKDISELLAKAPPPANKEALESLKKQAEEVLPELKEERESGWAEADGCKRQKCHDVLAKANDIGDKITKGLAQPEENKTETVEAKTQELTTEAPKKER